MNHEDYIQPRRRVAPGPVTGRQVTPIDESRFLHRQCGGSSSAATSNSSSATNTATDNSDNRQDNRTDNSDNSTHSQVSIDNSDHRVDGRTDNSQTDNSVSTYQNDNRIDNRSDNSVSIDDHSVNNGDYRQDNRQDNSRTTVSTTDARVTNITTLDGAVAQSAITGATDIARTALSNAEVSALQNTKLFESAAAFGDGIVRRSLDTIGDTTGAAFSFGGDALDYSDEAAKRALAFGGDALAKAAEMVSTGAKEDRAFAAQFLGNVFETQKSADQANTEKLVKAGTAVAVAAAVAVTAIKIFGKK